ncbi:hypothetical protein EV691_14220 [Azotobacter chroococcum]|uniref:Uncharacterized protein n=1 Tax=Azotobacter chroococcum TaxID=353 RepID=A0A4R1NZF7_9GAMM|nr:hypothetical protein EV691_14220 [Azotobacter chroococcum]
MHTVEKIGGHDQEMLGDLGYDIEISKLLKLYVVNKDSDINSITYYVTGSRKLINRATKLIEERYPAQRRHRLGDRLQPQGQGHPRPHRHRAGRGRHQHPGTAPVDPPGEEGGGLRRRGGRPAPRADRAGEPRRRDRRLTGGRIAVTAARRRTTGARHVSHPRTVVLTHRQRLVQTVGRACSNIRPMAGFDGGATKIEEVKKCI